MEKTKAVEESDDKAAPPAPAVEERKSSEKAGGPQTAGKLATPGHPEATQEQARRAAAMQRKVGNARLSRLLAERENMAAQKAKGDGDGVNPTPLSRAAK